MRGRALVLPVVRCRRARRGAWTGAVAVVAWVLSWVMLPGVVLPRVMLPRVVLPRVMVARVMLPRVVRMPIMVRVFPMVPTGLVRRWRMMASPSAMTARLATARATMVPRVASRSVTRMMFAVVGCTRCLQRLHNVNLVGDCSRLLVPPRADGGNEQNAQDDHQQYANSACFHCMYQQILYAGGAVFQRG